MCNKVNFRDTVRRIDVLCFGGEDWWYHNRGHVDMQLMRRFARLGTALYVNSIVMQKPNLQKGIGGGKSFSQKLSRKIKSILKGLKKSYAGFWVCSPLSLPLHHIGWARPVNTAILRWQLLWITRKLSIREPIVWVACPVACDVAIGMKKARLVYQRTDRFEEYPNVDTDIIRQYDRQLKAHADLVIYVNRTLYQEEMGQCRKSIYLDHGVDYDMFAGTDNDNSVPDDMKGIEVPIVGFFGNIDDHTSDMELIQRVTDLLPEMRFVFVGRVSVECRGLSTRKNVKMLGQKPYEQIPHYGKCFDVAIMPWQQNRWIAACNPVKLKEYLALGKPIVSTPFPELHKYHEVVYIGSGPEEFARLIKDALAEDGPERITARRKKVEKATWDSKVKLVLEELFGK